MKTSLHLLLATGILFGLATASFAQQAPKHRVPAPRERQQGQQQRIREGIRSGELTRGEVRSLEQEQREIRQEIRQAHTDGMVTRGERREIQQEQNQASRHITRAKHNRRDRN